MVKRRVLDTDTLSAFFKNQPQVVAQADRYLDDHEKLTTTIIAYYEIRRGLTYVDAHKRLADLEEFARENEVLGLDLAACQHAANVYADLRRRGKLIGEADILVAGIALAHDGVLVTNNVEHFQRVPNLKVENWLA
jgi:tRNA(fMet)-specific endonuclease VapC